MYIDAINGDRYDCALCSACSHKASPTGNSIAFTAEERAKCQRNVLAYYSECRRLSAAAAPASHAQAAEAAEAPALAVMRPDGAPPARKRSAPLHSKASACVKTPRTREVVAVAALPSPASPAFARPMTERMGTLRSGAAAPPPSQQPRRLLRAAVPLQPPAMTAPPPPPQVSTLNAAQASLAAALAAAREESCVLSRLLNEPAAPAADALLAAATARVGAASAKVNAAREAVAAAAALPDALS